MADGSYQDALKRRDALIKELKKLNDYIALHEEIFGTKEQQATLSFVKNDTQGEMSAGEGSGTATLRGVNPPRAVIGRRARVLILRKGHPMTRGELLQALENSGLKFVAADRSKSMGTTMWRLRDQFVNLDGLGYWPKDVPYPKGDYRPAE